MSPGHQSPFECTFEFIDLDTVRYGNSEAATTDIELNRRGLAYDTVGALSWYVSNSREQDCDPELLRLLGRYLFDFLLPPDKYAEIRSQVGAFCTARSVHFSLQFRPEARRYAQLPWEFLSLPPQPNNPARFLCEFDGVTLTLTRFVPSQKSVARRDNVLKVLVHVSSPGDQPEIAFANLKRELKKLQKESHERFQVTFELNKSVADIEKDIERIQPDIFHFSGHGTRDALWLAARSDRAAEAEALQEVAKARKPFGFNEAVLPQAFEVRIAAIAKLFKVHQPQLVVLDACNSDWSWLSEMLPGVAHQLVKSVPAVLAMRYRISNGASEKFSVEMYRNILNGAPLDEAVQLARNSLQHDDGEVPISSRAFGTPVLYLKDSSSMCPPMIAGPEAPPNVAFKSGQPGALPTAQGGVAACPRCNTENLFKGARCIVCRIPFECEECNAVYESDEIAVIRFCGKPGCSADYRDRWPWPPREDADYSRPGPVPVAPVVPAADISSLNEMRTRRGQDLGFPGVRQPPDPEEGPDKVEAS